MLEEVFEHVDCVLIHVCFVQVLGLSFERVLRSSSSFTSGALGSCPHRFVAQDSLFEPGYCVSD